MSPGCWLLRAPGVASSSLMTSPPPPPPAQPPTAACAALCAPFQGLVPSPGTPQEDQAVSPIPHYGFSNTDVSLDPGKVRLGALKEAGGC